MNPPAKILPYVGALKKGAAYGAVPPRAGGRATNGLHSNRGSNTHSAGRGPQSSAPGVSKRTKKSRRPDPRKQFASDAERQQARRVRFYVLGLNSSGKPYRRVRHSDFVNRLESPAMQAAQRSEQRRHRLKTKRANWQRHADANRAAGLRVDGKSFRRHKNFHAWKNFRAQVPAAPVASWEMIER
jgi:hypothetical protein